MRQGRFGFSDKIQQHGDIKSFEGTVPPEALAAGRVVVEFTDKPQPSTLPDMKKFEKDKMITSETGQLRWDFAGKRESRVRLAKDRQVRLGHHLPMVGLTYMTRVTLPSTHRGPRRWSVLRKGRSNAWAG